jgi:hypothetical protein
LLLLGMADMVVLDGIVVLFLLDLAAAAVD